MRKYVVNKSLFSYKSFFVDGGYTEWTIFGDCTALCQSENGERVRRRTCTNPRPQFGGLTCEG